VQIERTISTLLAPAHSLFTQVGQLDFVQTKMSSLLEIMAVTPAVVLLSFLSLKQTRFYLEVLKRVRNLPTEQSQPTLEMISTTKRNETDREEFVRFIDNQFIIARKE
jgi:hypothetical protein